MEKLQFLHRLDEIFAAFGKKNPESRIEGPIWSRICDLPDDFMAYAQTKLVDLERLPTNLGGYLIREILPEYQARQRLGLQLNGDCPECKGKGHISAYDADENPTDFPCVCRGGSWTRDRILESGGTLANPMYYRIPWPGTPEMRKALGCLGTDFPVRERHAEYMQGVEYD